MLTFWYSFSNSFHKDLEILCDLENNTEIAETLLLYCFNEMDVKTELLPSLWQLMS